MFRYFILLLIIEKNEGGEDWRYLKSLQAEKTHSVHE